MNVKLFLNTQRRFSLFLCVLMFLPSVIFAQSNVIVKFKNESLKNVLESISKQSKYKFIYTDEIKADEVKVSIESINESVEQLFNKLFNPISFSYVIKENQVIVGVKSTLKKSSVPAKKIIGCIKDDAGETIPGATIQNISNKQIVASDIDGKYSIDAKKGDLIVFSSIGMLAKTITVSDATQCDVALVQDAISLQDVIVTGYQTLSKERSTGSFAVVTSKSLEKKLQPNVKSILEGQSAGVVVNKSGEIEIRGISTISGVNTPLIVVDGYPLIGSGVGLESINSENIENITVLKDAVAASIYGARASNGVIVVTTKKAVKGIFTIGYKGTYSITLKPDLNKLNIASTADYMDAELDLYNQNPNSYYSNYSSYYRISDYAYLLMAKDKGLMSVADADNNIALLKNNNALKQIGDKIIQAKQSQQHNINISGGTDKNLFNGVLHYTKELGNLKNNSNSRLIFDFNDNWKPAEWITLRVLGNINYATSENTVDTWNSLTDFGSTSKLYPYSQLYDNNGNLANINAIGQKRWNLYNTYPGMKPVSYNPISDMPLNMTNTQNLQVRLGGDATVKFCNWLNGSIGGSWIKGYNTSKTIWDGDSFTMRTAYNDGTSISNPTKHYIPDGGRIIESRGSIQSWVIRGQLNYNQAFKNNEHRITAMLGSEISKDTYEISSLGTRLGYDPISATWNSGFDIYGYNNNVGNIESDMLFNRKPTTLASVGYPSNYGARDNRFVSWYGNAYYEYKDKYVVSGSVRLDLTNFFGTDPKFRYKPTWSVGSTYKISKENFFKPLLSVVDMLFLRASYGINGNISLNNTPFLILGVGSHNQTMGGVSYSISSYPNNQLRWERTRILNLGLDLAMFKGRFNLGVDFYNKVSTDLIANDEIDETKGTSAIPQNVGSIRNRGIEITLNSDIIRNNTFTWNSGIILSHNSSTVLTYNIKRAYFGSYTNSGTILVKGYETDGYWGGRFAGLNNQGQALFYNVKGEKVQGGSLKAEDAVYLGQFRPKVDMSWTNNFKFRNIEASFMFVGKFGHKYRKDAFIGSNYNNRHVSERWKKAGDEANTIYPKLLSWNMDMFYFPYSDVLIDNASYVKLRDLTLAYTLPKKVLRTLHISNLKVYFQTRNLFYITGKSVDIDPETAELNSSGGTSAMTNQAFTSLQLRPEFYFGLQINL